MGTGLHGRHALVTGGSRGIGLAVAHALLKEGARVTVLGRDPATLRRCTQALQAQGDIGWVAADITDRAALEAAFVQAVQRAGRIDILVNNAGQALSQRFDQLAVEQWQQMLAVNLTGSFHCSQLVLPGMREGGWGRIVNVASTAALAGYRYVSAYCAAKHGVLGLTRALALETAAHGITVNAVCPGYTDTDIVASAVDTIAHKTGVSPQQAREGLAARNPQGRLIHPEEVANAVLWLCQTGSSAINGQAIAVDGGETAG